MNTHESYVSLEIAQLLKEAWFDWPCNHAICCNSTNFPNLKEGDVLEYNYLECSELMEGKKPHMLLCPTLDVAQRWLREVKNIEICISWEIEFKEKELDWDERRYCYDVDTHVDDIPLLSINDDYWSEGYHTFGNSYSTYEEALEAGIKRALELLLKKGE